MWNYIKFLALIAVLVPLCCGSRVLELSDKFSEIYKEGGFWLVKFYAPWCGHCKRLEPVWAQVAQALYKTNIRVGKVDCTRFPSLATEFSVGGFPTVKFIKPGEHFTYHGDRTKDDIVNFAIRMAGPPVQEVTRSESLTNLKQMNQLFFMFVGEQNGALWDAFFNVASKLQPHGFFYVANKDIAKQHVDLEELPAVFVYKESLHFFYTIDSGAPQLNPTEEIDYLNSSMYKWINEERFETFPKVTRGNINELLQTKKFLVLAVVEENKLQQITQEMIEFRDMIESVIRRKRDKFHKNFQFGWIGTPDLANSIAMQVLPLPHLLVLNSTTNHHHIPEDDPTQLTADAVANFLEGIYNQTVPVLTVNNILWRHLLKHFRNVFAAIVKRVLQAYGGNSVAVRIYRTYFEARTSLADMWKGNPVLTTVLFGLPLGFLSLILYSICCSDILDAEEDEEEELLHEKKE